MIKKLIKIVWFIICFFIAAGLFAINGSYGLYDFRIVVDPETNAVIDTFLIEGFEADNPHHEDEVHKKELKKYQMNTGTSVRCSLKIFDI